MEANSDRNQSSKSEALQYFEMITNNSHRSFENLEEMNSAYSHNFISKSTFMIKQDVDPMFSGNQRGFLVDNFENFQTSSNLSSQKNGENDIYDGKYFIFFIKTKFLLLFLFFQKKTQAKANQAKILKSFFHINYGKLSTIVKLVQ